VSSLPPNIPPTAFIDYVNPREAKIGEIVEFSGHGTDSDGYTTDYWWGSSIDGFLNTSDNFNSLSLSVGEHTIYFMVEDNDSEWSLPAKKTLNITSPYTLSDFDWQFATNNVVVIYPSDNTPKPLGCAAAWVSDWTASAFVTTKLQNYAEGLDTNSNFVNQTSGRPLGGEGLGIISFGGPMVNPVVKYAESSSTPSADRAPIVGYEDGGIFYFQLSNGSSIPGASLPFSVINHDEDMFVIEVYMDGSGRYMMVCYGFGWKGTYAAGKYFDTTIYPNLGSCNVSWMIAKWQDTNNDGFVNNPNDGDTYTIIANMHA